MNSPKKQEETRVSRLTKAVGMRYNKTPSDLTEEELTRIVRFACTAASLSTQKHGGITSVPGLPEVTEKLN